MVISPLQQTLLLRIARESIESILGGRRPAYDAASFDEELRRPAGAFVTLTTADGALRGCIGTIRAVEPLYLSVSTSAINAATRDPRFPPVRREELPSLSLEISVMGPIEPVADTEEIMVGRDGLIISRGRNAGLLLPQVATEYGWDRLTFLRQTCVKAGLAPETWQSPDCRIERFAAHVFGEA